MPILAPSDHLRRTSRRWLVAAVALGAFLVPTQMAAASDGEDPPFTTTTVTAPTSTVPATTTTVTAPTSTVPASTTTVTTPPKLNPSTDAPVSARPTFTG